jgi:hypothetical protein
MRLTDYRAKDKDILRLLVPHGAIQCSGPVSEARTWDHRHVPTSHLLPGAGLSKPTLLFQTDETDFCSRLCSGVA